MKTLKRTFSMWRTIETYWREAFPAEIDIESRLQKRRQEAIKQRELEEKILEGRIVADEHIPEWKRGALIKTETSVYDHEEKGFFDKLTKGILSTKKENDELGLFEEELSEMHSYKQNLRENIANRFTQTDNLVLNKVKDAYDKVKVRFGADVYMEMRRRYPDFDTDVFEEELKYIFVDMYNRYLKHDIEYIQRVCGADAYAMFSGLIQSQMKKDLVHKFTDILNVTEFRIDSAMLTDNKTPLFICTIKLYEIECLVDMEDTNKIIQGNIYWPAYRDFGLFYIPHPKPDIEAVGHEWVIIKAEDRTKNLQIENMSENQRKTRSGNGESNNK